eukprot:13600610-Heterocapsa_arctica.AAC.1
MDYDEYNHPASAEHFDLSMDDGTVQPMTTSDVTGFQASMATTRPYGPGSGIVVPMSSAASTVQYAPGTASSVSAASTV